jgi:brefeldin A-resistance guanine nucleotide exchange factor 1
MGMSETRMQAAQLLCKIFLHYLVLLSEWEGVLDLWIKILGIMDRLMNSGQSDTLEEAVPESLKNILLVMSSGGYLVPPSENSEDQTDQQKQLWAETWTRLHRFLPDLMPSLFPEEANKSKQATRVDREAPASARDEGSNSQGEIQFPERPSSAVAEPQKA